MLELRAALSGTWASNVRMFLILFLPCFALVLFQESTHSGISWQLVTTSAIVQHLVSAFVIGSLCAAARAIWGFVPIAVNLVAWILLGIGRGLASGIVYLLFSQNESQFTPESIDPQFLVRCTYWVSICLIWMPLFIYVASQIDQRRTLLREAEQATNLRDAAGIRAERTAGDLSAQLVSAVRDAIAPVIADISRSLEAVGPALSPATFTAIGERLARVSQDATNIISGVDGAKATDSSLSRSMTPLAAAMDFERKRPVFAGVLTGLVLAAIVLPNALNAGGFDDALVALLAIPMTTIVLIGLVTAQSRVRTSRTDRQLPLLITTYFAAGLAGSFILIVINAGVLETYDLILVTLLPIGVTICAITISSAVGLSSANRELGDRIRALSVETAQLAIEAEEKEKRVRSSLSTLMHGPVQGRLSACVMALTFHAQEGENADPERTSFITNAVLDHLETASRDLDALVATDSAGSSHLDFEA